MNESAKNQLLLRLKEGYPLRSALNEINSKLSIDKHITYGQAYAIVNNLYQYYKPQIEASSNEHLARELDLLQWLTDQAASMITTIDDYSNWASKQYEVMDNEAKILELSSNIHNRNIANKTNILTFIFKIADARMKIFNLYKQEDNEVSGDHNFVINMKIDDEPDVKNNG